VDQPIPTAPPPEPASPGPEPTPAPPEEASPKADRARGRPMTIALRVVAILVILGAMFALGHVLRSPTGWGGGGGGGGLVGDADAFPPEVEEAFPPVPPPGPRPTVQQEPRNSLRQLMAGLLMVAAGGEDAPEDPDAGKPTDPTAAQRRVADWFGLPHDYPASAAPSGLVPPGADVLMVIGDPDREKTWMVLVRVRQGVDAALESFYRHYQGRGWKADTLRSPALHHDAQPDRGWLVRFSKGQRERLLYAQVRDNADETLLAVYDPDYEGE